MSMRNWVIVGGLVGLTIACVEIVNTEISTYIRRNEVRKQYEISMNEAKQTTVELLDKIKNGSVKQFHEMDQYIQIKNLLR